MRWTENETKFIPTEYLQCDFCNHDAKKEHRRVQKCYFCGKDICSQCAIWFDVWSDLESPNYSGDYPDFCCKKCWDDGKEIRDKIMTIRKEAEDKEEALVNQWIAQSRK